MLLSHLPINLANVLNMHNSSQITVQLLLVLATFPNRQNSSRLRLEQEPNCCNRIYHTKTRTVAMGPVLQPKTWLFNITNLAAIEYLSSDRIVT